MSFPTRRAPNNATIPDHSFASIRSFPEKDDVYKKVLDTAKEMAREGVIVRGVPVTDELYDIILFLTHSFVRPIVSELYAIKHNDVTVAENPKRLIVVVRDGKDRISVRPTRCPGAVAVYERTRKRNPDARGEDYIFLPQYQNRHNRFENHSAAVQGADDASRGSKMIRSSGNEAHDLLTAPHRDLHADYSVGGSGQYFQSCQKRRHVGRSNRALLCAQPSAVERNGYQLAEFWKWVIGSVCVLQCGDYCQAQTRDSPTVSSSGSEKRRPRR